MRDQSDSVMYRLLLSRTTTGPIFNFVPCMEGKISGKCGHSSSKPFMYKELIVRKFKTWLKMFKSHEKEAKKLN